MDFISIDVETANSDMASICQIGIAVFSEGSLVDEWASLVDPEDYFDDINISIHGITPSDVIGTPIFSGIASEISSRFRDSIIVSHTSFDRVSIGRAFTKYKLDQPDSIWLDSAKVVRRAWPQFSRKGYGLKNVAEHIGYEFQHHDALEDAKAAGRILIEAINSTDLALSDWLTRVNKPINPRSSASSKVTREGNPDGELAGETIVFTGSLQITRAEAADLAAQNGCKVVSSVSKKTTLLVVGDQDLTKLVGKSKSSKHIKAEQLNLEGNRIRVLKESDFLELIRLNRD